MKEVLLDSLLDSLKLVPFLFLSFVIMELIEHKLTNTSRLAKMNKFGPLAGSFLGIVPQCGFSALASNLYAARVITLGTLFSVYLSTSDEMLPILISHHTNFKDIFLILLTKFTLGFIFGLLVDNIYQRKNKPSKEIHDICSEEHCHCSKNSIIKSSLIHTLKITFFILLVNIFLSSIIDKTLLTNFTKENIFLTPLIISIIGLIPNCASSVIITELYLDNVITFGSCISGLLSGSGIGLLVLFKQNHHYKENILILLSLVLISSICGIILNLLV